MCFRWCCPARRRSPRFRPIKPIGLILSGGPSSVYDADAPAADPEVLELGVPVLGVCYGLHFIVHHLGGKVLSAPKREYGHAEVTIEDQRDAAVCRAAADDSGLDEPRRRGARAARGFSPHRRHRKRAGRNRQRGAAHLGRAVSSRGAPHAAGAATHPELLFTICGAAGDWTPAHFIETTVAAIREKVGKGHVICGLSGGVDSSVAAVLVHKAIGSQLTCIFVNNGVLRKNEFPSVQKNLRDKLGLNIVAVDASERFLAQLAGVTDPEDRSASGSARSLSRSSRTRPSASRKQTGGVDWLVQGTLYPDVIESCSVKGPSQTIKSHHNVGGLPERHEAQTD